MLRAPLLHFLVLGGLLFVLQTGFGRASPPRTVEVLQSEIDERIEAFALQVGRPPDPNETRALADQAIEDAVWLDQAFAVGLPEIDGYETARRIRALPGGDRVRLIAVTGWGQQEDKQRARAAGFDAHLTKPVESSAVSALLTNPAQSAA